MFWVKPNTVKNDRDSFDPFYDNDRAGWHQAEALKPALKRIKDYADEIDDTELIGACKSLREREWLPDLKKVFEACKKATESTGLLPSCLELSDRSITELRAHPSDRGSRGWWRGPVALTIKTKDRGQE